MKATALKIKPMQSAELAMSFEKVLTRFRADKDVQIGKLFRIVDSQVIVDLDSARRISRGGFRADGIEVLSGVLGLPGRDAVADVLGASGVTLWRRAKEKKPLPEALTEQIIRTMELQLQATEVFGGAEQAQQWLGRPHPSLDGHSPFEYASNEYGARKVRGILAALQHGGVA